jgi:hypothetical protein
MEQAGMVASFSRRLDYEFVIWLFGSRGFGFPEFISWSALKPAPAGKTAELPTREQPLKETP